MLDGAAKLGELIDGRRRAGHAGAGDDRPRQRVRRLRLLQAGKGAGVKPIIGMEAYFTPGTRFDRAPFASATTHRRRGTTAPAAGAYTHMTLLAAARRGHAQPVPHLLAGQPRGAVPQARASTASCSSATARASSPPPAARRARSRPGCGPASTTRPRRPPPTSRTSSARRTSISELMDHGLDIERRTREDLLRLARDLDLRSSRRTTCTTRTQQDAEAHEALLCVQSGSTLADPNRFKFDGDGFYLKSAAEMRRCSRDLPEACDNTLLIAERCEVTFNRAPTTCRASRCRRGRTRTPGSSRRSSAA